MKVKLWKKEYCMCKGCSGKIIFYNQQQLCPHCKAMGEIHIRAIKILIMQFKPFKIYYEIQHQKYY